ncbi:MAG TPA: hypothetical protein VNM14_16775 [Planctomycetota bacterium]|nr:hypothetical protein [Planctomycetota bacterium]
MKKNEIARLWQDFAGAPQRALQMAALLDRAPLPLDLVADTDRELASAIAAGLVTVQEHDLWGWSLLVDGDLRDFLNSSKDVAPLSDKDQQGLVRKVADAYCRYFVWPPTEMLQNSIDMDPHVEATLGIARGLKQWDDVSRMQHQRALLHGWRTQKFELPLKWATEAADALYKTDGGKPHPGTLALVLSGLATWQQFTKRFKEARKTLVDAEKALIPLVGKKTIEPFLLYCQIGTVCARMDDLKGMKKAQDEAREIAKAMQNPKLDKHIQQTLSWAQWHLQHYIGL